MKARTCLGLLIAAALVVPSSALAGHGLRAMLDHPAPSFSEPAPLSSTVNSGGEGAKWELIETIPTGNPLTDIDFFTRGGSTYASVGTLAGGPNGGGQTIVQLIDQEGNVEPAFVTGHPSATCISNPSAALGLQHDVEAAPKGDAILNTTNPSAVRSDTQVLIDATDQRGRCHDQGVLGLQGAPRGGLEIIDVTDPANPKEIGLTSHIGEAHTVNVDPKRPHIAYAVTSDAVEVKDTGQRDNENPTDTNQAGAIEPNPDRFDLDGFEVVDFSSCLEEPLGTIPPGTPADAPPPTVDKRDLCRPQVYRYRYPTTEMALGHTQKTGANGVFGCHELEVYPDDRLTCGSGNALIVFDMSGAFNDNGTPNDFSDDHPNGQPLPCQVRESSSEGPFFTGAMVTDCVNGLGDGTEDLNVPNWLNSGAPSLAGVEWLGSIHHQGRGAGGVGQAFDATQDIDFNHEAELSHSGKLLIATDERGGGVQPPGATCTPAGDNPVGNGGVHFYRYEGLHKNGPLSAQAEHQAYARTPDGKKAIFRAPIRTQPRGTVCTAHVFQQVPGENRIFMGWYSQGTRVIDFVENPDGTVSFKQAGFFIPENANEWVSHVFKTEQHADCSVTYWGATGDFNLGEAGRNAIDVYKVTLPPPPLAAGSGPCGLVAAGPGAEQPGGPCAQRIRGTNRRDRLLGSIAGDTISARRGRDQVRARAGDDCVKAGAGGDLAMGNAGNDQLQGGGAKDRLRGNAGDDQLRDTRAGRDRLSGGSGSDRLLSRGGGRDLVACGPGRDRAVVNQRDRTRGCERVRARR